MGQGNPQDTEAQYRAVFEGVGDAVFIHRMDAEAPTGRFVAANDVACRHLGYTREELLCLSLPQIDPLDEAVIPSVLEVLKAGGEALFETAHITKDGRRVPVEVRARIISYLGAPAVLSVARDITERKHAEAKLRHVTRLYAVLSQINQTIVRTRDRDELFGTICRVAIDIGGFQMAWVGLADEATGIVSPVVHAGHEQGYLADISISTANEPAGRGPTGSALQGGTIVTCDDIATDPHMRPWREGALKRGYRSSAAVPFRLKGAVIGTLNLYAAEAGFFTEDERKLLEDIGGDISLALDAMEAERDRKQGEERLVESKERYRSFFDNAAVAVAVVDKNGRVVEANDADCRFLGYSRSELIGMHFTEFTHPDDIDLDVDLYRALIAGQRHGYEIEKRYLRKDGEVVWGRLAVSLVRDSQGLPLYTSVVCYDITDRKRAEEQRIELERRLLHAQKLESLGVLAGGIAHDFNNLLMAVLGNLELALRSLPLASPARLNIEQSAQAARRATDLTRQMLAYSGKGRFVVKAMDLNELVEEHARLMRSSATRTATLELRLDRSLPPVEADAGQVVQVIMNLLTNASDALGEETGRITITTGVRECDDRFLRSSRIEEVPPPGRFVVLEVSDTGCGMDARTVERLFDPFFSTKAAGRGLGMSAILGIVRGHGGALFVDSAVGAGTTVRVLFPALAASARPAAASAQAGAAPARARALSGTVLVADDEEAVRSVCAAMVRNLGMEVLTASDGREALEVFRQNAERISHVILDLTMPNMDGISACKEMLRLRPEVKITLSSGYGEQDTIQRMAGCGPAAFIQKPYSLEKLGEALDAAGRPARPSIGDPE